jgi:hypothetical protein
MLTPVKNWALFDVPGLPAQALATKGQNGFAPNLNMVDEKWAGNLDEYVRYSQAELVKQPAFERSSSSFWQNRHAIKVGLSSNMPDILASAA